MPLTSPPTLRIGASTPVSVRFEQDIPPGTTYVWTADAGRIEGEGTEAIYTAPDRRATACLTVTAVNKGSILVRESRPILVYKQFIILKADDVVHDAARGLSPRWLRFVEYVGSNGLKASLGIIGKSLEKAAPASLRLLHKLGESGQFTFANHGYSHELGAWSLFGGRYDEFRNAPYARQRSNLLKAQALARERLGVTLRTFYAPGNCIDGETLRVVDEVDDIVVWLFGDPRSKKLVLGRIADVEYPTHNPDSGKFKESYDTRKDLLVLQLHPDSWDASRFGELERIMADLRAEGVTFVLPEEYYDLVAPSEERGRTR